MPDRWDVLMYQCREKGHVDGGIVFEIPHAPFYWLYLHLTYTITLCAFVTTFLCSAEQGKQCIWDTWQSRKYLHRQINIVCIICVPLLNSKSIILAKQTNAEITGIITTDDIFPSWLVLFLVCVLPTVESCGTKRAENARGVPSQESGNDNPDFHLWRFSFEMSDVLRTRSRNEYVCSRSAACLSRDCTGA